MNILPSIGQVGRTPGRVVRSVLLATVLTGGFGGLMPMVANADSPDISTAALGTVIGQDSVTLPSTLEAIASGKRVVYVSSDANNTRVLASALVMTPDTHPTHANIVTWSHALSGVANQCAPSVDSADYFYPEAQAAVAAYLGEGWTVAATDYAGLGTPGAYQAFVGNTEARSVIDSVRAARNLNSSLSHKWVAAGHSGGGSSPIFAGEITDSYGAGLKLKGIVSMAPASNLDAILPFAAGTPLNGYFPIALYGLGKVDPSLNWRSYLAAPARALLPVLHSGCVFDILGAYQDLTAEQLLVDGALPDSILAEIGHYDNPGQVKSSAPILLLQGTADEEIPASLTELLQSEECAVGSKSVLQELDGVGHDDLPIVTTATQTAYMQARFDGDPAPNDCD